MRPLILISLALTLLTAGQTEARLFYQTYGSVVATGESCTWNTNQDYFVPRYCSSCRYGLFSPCKESCTKSPACRVCHHLYPGYCGIYGNWHYCWRNHVYKCHCGCEPVLTYCGPYRHGCGPYSHCCGCRPCVGCCRMGCTNGPCCYPLIMEYGESLANVEPPQFEVLGRIAVEGDELLASLNMSAGAEQLPGVVLPPATPPAEPRPLFGKPTEPLPPLPSSP